MKPFQHELVVTQGGVRVIFGQSEQCDQGQAESVGLQNGIIQGGVVFGPLGGLHPVKYVLSGLRFFPIQLLDSRLLNHPGRFPFLDERT